MKSPRSAPVQLRIRSHDRHNIPPFLYKKINLKLDSNDQRNCNYVFSALLKSLCPYLHCLHCFFVSLFFFEKKKNRNDVQAIERLIQCQFSFWVIPIHHSDLGDACPVAASALIHCPPVTKLMITVSTLFFSKGKLLYFCDVPLVLNFLA